MPLARLARLACLALVASLVGLVPSAPGSAAAESPAAARVAIPEPFVSIDGAVEYLVVDRAEVPVWFSSNDVGEDVFDEHLFDVQVRRGSVLSTDRPAWRDVRAVRGTHRTLRTTLRIAPGTAWCVRARERYPVPDGLVSAWSRPDCVVRPVDDARAQAGGGRRFVRARALHDDRASELGDSGRLVLRGVPAGTIVGVLVVGYRVPEWRVGRSAFSSSGTGGTGRGLGWLARSTRVGGTLEVRGSGRDPVGGLVVVPRWLR